MMQLRAVTSAAIAAATFAFSAPSYAFNEETLIRPGVARVTVGRVFGPGDRLFSANQEFRFERQTDGNLVVRRNSDDKVYWASDTDNKGVQTVTFDRGPLLRASTSASRTIWSAGYQYRPNPKDRYNPRASEIENPSGSISPAIYYDDNPSDPWPDDSLRWRTGFLDIQNDGNLIIKVLTNAWTNGKSSTDYGGSNFFFPANSYIYKGSSYSAGNGHYKLTFQNDGNLVITQDGTPIWSTNTAGKGGTYAVVQDDGNFVIYNNAKQAVWSAKNYRRGSNYLVLRTDGQLDLISEEPIWDSASDKGNKL